MSYKVVSVTDNLVNLLRRCCDGRHKSYVASVLGMHRLVLHSMLKGDYKSPFVPYEYLENAKRLTDVNEEEFKILTLPEKEELTALARKCGEKQREGVPGLVRRMRLCEPWSNIKERTIYSYLLGVKECSDPYITVETYSFLKAVSREPAPAPVRASTELTQALYRLTDESPKVIIDRFGIDLRMFESAAYPKHKSRTVPIEIKEIFEAQAVRSHTGDFYGAIKREIIDKKIARTAKEFRALLPMLSEYIDAKTKVESLYSPLFWSTRIVLRPQHYRLMALESMSNSRKHSPVLVQWEDFKKTLDVFRNLGYSEENICRIIGISDIHELLTPADGTIKALAECYSRRKALYMLRMFHPKMAELSAGAAESYLNDEGKDPVLRGITYRFLMIEGGKDPLELEEMKAEDDDLDSEPSLDDLLVMNRGQHIFKHLSSREHVPRKLRLMAIEAEKEKTTNEKGAPLVDSRTFELKKLETLLYSDLARERDPAKRELAKRKILRKFY